MADKKFDYMISVKKLIPPVGLYKYIASIEYCYETSGKKDIKANIAIGESWGKTEDEARDKLTYKIKEWISKQ